MRFPSSSIRQLSPRMSQVQVDPFVLNPTSVAPADAPSSSINSERQGSIPAERIRSIRRLTFSRQSGASACTFSREGNQSLSEVYFSARISAQYFGKRDWLRPSLTATAPFAALMLNRSWQSASDSACYCVMKARALIT